ncbi:TPA: hypothetical protein ACTXW7_003809, partial [Legionella anisa]
MYRYLMTSFIVFSALLTDLAIAKSQRIWLQDTNCVMMYVQDKKINAKEAGLTNYVCSINDLGVLCSITAVNSNDTFDGKPSKILSFTKIGDSNHVVYVGNDHNQMIIIDYKTNTYNSSNT